MCCSPPTGGYCSTVLIQLDSYNGWLVNYKSQKIKERRYTSSAILDLARGAVWKCGAGTTTELLTGNDTCV